MLQEDNQELQRTILGSQESQACSILITMPNQDKQPHIILPKKFHGNCAKFLGFINQV